MTAIKQVRKAVIPAAGLGTRVLPATKATPKEMLPIVDKPTIQYIIEEALASGIEDILIITGRSKRAIEDHFDRSIELELNLAAGGKGVAQPLNDADRQTATEIGRVLAPRGLLLVGLDIIGDKVTEINVTSPTCFQEIHDQTGCDVAFLFVDALEEAVAARA